MKKKTVQYDPQNDLYARLGVATNENADAIQQAYRKLAKSLHPDVNPDRREWATQEFQRLNEAYDILGDRELRQQYDKSRYLATGTRSGPQDNWWDTPHPVHPDYRSQARPQPTAARPAPPPPPRANGEWLRRWGLGFLKPIYLAFYEAIYSPYRPILIILMLVLGLNLVFLILSIGQTSDTRSVVLPDQISPITPVATRANPTPIPTSTQLALIPCSDTYQLTLVGLEKGPDRLKLQAIPFTVNLRSQAVTWQAIRLSEGNSAVPMGPLEAVDLLFVQEAPSATIALDELALAANIPTGTYLLRWQPINPDGSSADYCDQVVVLGGE